MMQKEMLMVFCPWCGKECTNKTISRRRFRGFVVTWVCSRDGRFRFSGVKGKSNVVQV